MPCQRATRRTARRPQIRKLAIGVGWSAAEFDALGQEFHTRGRRTDEILDVLHGEPPRLTPGRLTSVMAFLSARAPNLADLR